MKFIFKAKTATGKIKEGKIDAINKGAALDMLQKNELFPTFLSQEKEKINIIHDIMKYFNSVSAKELMVFFRQLSILIEAKVPIVYALSAIKEQMENKFFKSVVSGMENDIKEGMPLSDAMAKNKDIFSSLAINIIKSGETSGNLKKSIDYVAKSIENSYSLTSKIRLAMTYPIIVVIVFAIVAFLVISFIIPKLTMIFKEADIVIPWYTKVVMLVSDFMHNFWWLIISIIFFIVVGTIYYIKTQDGRKRWDRIKLSLPIFGTVFKNLYVSRIADNLHVLLIGGIPIIRAITLVSDVVNNVVYRDLMLKIAEEVKIGGNMSDVMKKSQYIPSIVSQMVKIGEESGQIDVVLNHIARFYEQETDNMTKNLTSMIEPILMIVIGIGVGILAFTVLLPIYNMAGQMQ